MSSDSFQMKDSIEEKEDHAQAKIGQNNHGNIILAGVVFFLLGFLANNASGVLFEDSKTNCPSIPNSSAPSTCGETTSSSPNAIFDLTKTASKVEIANKGLAFLTERYLKPQGITSEFKGIEAEGDDLYKLNFILKKDGIIQEGNVYLTKDGKLILLGDGGGVVDITTHETDSTPTQEDATATSISKAIVNVGDAAYAFGSEDAQVTMVEFNDFQCPFCKKFRDETFDLIRQRYGDKVRYVFMDFPITNIHPHAFVAHVAARCAGAQGKYLEYHDKLFSSQKAWSAYEPNSPGEIDELKKYAKDISLDSTVFDKCLDSRQFGDDVLANIQKGMDLEITGTPTFYINGQRVVGAQAFDKFREVIEGEFKVGG